MSNKGFVQSKKLVYGIDDRMILPESNYVDVGKIAKLFNDNNQGYKFYLFWSILEEILKPDTDTKKNGLRIKVDKLCKRMIALSCYTINECKLNIGAKNENTTNQLKIANEKIYKNYRANYKDSNEFYKDDIIIKKIGNDEVINKCIDDLKNNVFFRLISPWISKIFGSSFKLNEKNIEKLNEYAKKNITWESKPPYCFEIINGEYYLVLEKDYLIYLVQNNYILQEWTKYELSKWLSKRNPSVPGIINKLLPPELNRQLKKQRDMYKFIYENSNNKKIDINIYSDGPIRENILNNNYELDHFIPFSYCSHNEWWNLTPTTKDINGTGAKGNKIPNDIYLSKLIEQQYYICKEIQSNDLFFDKFFKYNFIDEKMLYEVYFKRDVTIENFSNAMKDTINPMITTAINQGFKRWNVD